MSWRIEYAASVDKDISQLPHAVRTRVFERIARLPANPFPPGVKRLAGAKGRYRIRVGDYRIIYRVFPAERLIVVQRIRHRRDVYRNL